MFYLSQIFEDLSYGELSQLFIGADEEGGIQEENYRRVISFINLGMIDLYKKFNLREKSITVQQYAAITDYLLTDDFAVTDPNVSGEDPKYILDTVADPFLNDILQIQEVYDEDDVQLPLNDINSTTSVFTPTEKTLRILEPDSTKTISLLYRAYPNKIAADITDPTVVEVVLPEHLQSALMAYIGYRAHIAMPGGEASSAASYYSGYKNICADIVAQGVINKDNRTNLKLDTNNWA